MDKDDYPLAIADLLDIPAVTGKGGPWMSTEGTVLSDWVRAVAEVLDVEYDEKVRTMRRLVEAVGESWKAGMASAHTPSGGGGNITEQGFKALYDGLQTYGPALQRRRTNEGSPPYPTPTPNAEADRVSMRAIRQRRGQPKFRANLLSAYGYTCAFSGCDAPAALEAAHITRYGDGGTYDTSNGLLLRADIHTLFDLHLVTVDVASNAILLNPELSGSTYAAELAVRKFKPASGKSAPNRAALLAHRKRCGL